MRYTSTAIRQFLAEQPLSGLRISDFCEARDLKVPTFYSWRRKYSGTEEVTETGFCKITAKREYAERSLRLPSGLRLELAGLAITEIAELILEIDRAHA